MYSDMTVTVTGEERVERREREGGNAAGSVGRSVLPEEV